MNSSEVLNVYDTAYSTCLALAKYLAQTAKEIPAGEKKNIAVSGGFTPKLLFSIMKDIMRDVPWNNFNVFWTDERIVPIESLESNYGEFYRITGMDDGLGFETYPYLMPQMMPEMEKIEDHNIKESKDDMLTKITKLVPFKNGLPSFDLILLGIGDDGHTASIFSNNLESFKTTKIIEKVTNPHNLSQRLSLSGSVLNNAQNIIFLCTGKGKSKVVSEVYRKTNMNYPASNISPLGQIIWYLDKGACDDLCNYVNININK